MREVFANFSVDRPEAVAVLLVFQRAKMRRLPVQVGSAAEQ